MTVNDIQPKDWWCFAHDREKEMMLRDGRYVMVCPACEAEEMMEKKHG